MSSDYQIIEHPADIGIAAKGKTLIEAYANAALGLMSLIIDPRSTQPKEERYLEVHGDDKEHLLVRWLSDILYLYDGEKFVTANVEIERMSSTELRAKLSGERFDPNIHDILMDVKAITYHELSIIDSPDRYEVRFIVDI